MLSLCLASCASWRSNGSATPGAPVEYVEIPNPMATQSKDAPATIWVPVSAEKGIPRGSILVQEGVDKVKEGFTGKPSTPAPVPAAGPVVFPATAVPLAAAIGAPPAATNVAFIRQTASPVAVKKRIAILETGSSGLVAPFSDQLRGLGIGVPVDLSGADNLAAASVKESGRSAYAGQLWQENTASVLVVISAPDGIGAGKSLVADIYDGIEMVRLRRVTTLLPAFAGADKSSLVTPCADLALRVGDIVNLTPWYGRIFAVDGERVYLNAGRESGIQTGQKLKVYRGGKVIAGIGFDPGAPLATLEVAGFVGTNGSYGVVKDGQGVKLTDIVSIN